MTDQLTGHMLSPNFLVILSNAAATCSMLLLCVLTATLPLVAHNLFSNPTSSPATMSRPCFYELLWIIEIGQEEVETERDAKFACVRPCSLHSAKYIQIAFNPEFSD